MGDLTSVAINFDTSHLVFPILISGVLAVLGLAIVVTRSRSILAAGPYWIGVLAGIDKARFFGTIMLTVTYFMAMVPVGDIWPNRGLGFLFCSIPYVFLTGTLFLHDRAWRDILPVAIMALVAPSIAWWLFTELFFLTLP